LSWPLDPSVYAGLLALWLGYAWLARDREPSRLRSLFFGLGLLALWVALETPIDTISDRYLDSVHMVQHVLLGVIAPPLLLLGLSEPMAARIAALPGLRALTAPVPAQLAAAVVMVGWHLPLLYDATLRWEELHVVEHLTFVASGVLFWWPLIRTTSAGAGWVLSAPGKLLYLLVGTLPQDGVALVLSFSRVPFYDFYTHAPRLVSQLDPVTDQTLAGGTLMVLGKASFVVAALAIFFRWATAPDGEEAEAGAAALRATVPR
jgi:putative membrane protein